MNSPLWKLENVTLAGRWRPRLDAVSLEIPAGVTAVLGYSGAGKTSLLNLLVGFESPTSGKITQQFEQPGHGSSSSAGKQLPLYWCPPDDGLWPHLTVREHLALVIADSGRMSAQVEELLQRFHLETIPEGRPDRLSEGERTRLSVARALAADPCVLVMDEPLIHVDPTHLGDYWSAVHQHAREQNMSLVFSSHEPETVLREASHAICLDAGRVAWQGAVEDLYHRPPSLELAGFLGPVNWFAAEELDAWFTTGSVPVPSAEQAVSLRPEELAIRETPDAPLIVEQAMFSGSVGEADLRHERSGAVRRVFHRLPAEKIKRGLRVALSAMVLGCCALILPGCDGSAEGNTLPIESFSSQSLSAEGAFLPAPRAMTFSPEGELYVLDDAGRVLVYGPDGECRRQWWMPDYDVGKPEGVVVLADGRIAVADTHYQRVVFFNSEGDVLGMFGEQGEEEGQFIYPSAIAQDGEGNLYVAEYGGNDRVQKFRLDGGFLLEFGQPGTEPGEFQRASGVACLDETIFVADVVNSRVQAFSQAGEFLRVVADAETCGLDYPYDVALGTDGMLYVAEFRPGRVTQFTPEGQIVGHFGSTGRGENEFWTPWGVAVDNDGRILVADTGNRRIVELVP